MTERNGERFFALHEDHLFINKDNVLTYVVDGRCFTTCLELRWHLRDCGFNHAEQLEFLRGLKKVYQQDNPFAPSIPQ